MLTGIQLGLPGDRELYLKMDCWQPAGSFKIRGIGHLCAYHRKQGRKGLVSSSGGNAGFAASYAAREMNIRCTVVVPETTTLRSKEAILRQGAEVIVHGDVWDEADGKARELTASGELGYVPPFDHPLIWKGNSSLIDEMVDQMEKPDALVVSVGGGGLLCGIYQGLERNGWKDVHIIAVETKGADSFHQALPLGRPVDIGAITSVAKTLGARMVAKEAVERAKDFSLQSVVVEDKDAIQACVNFARDGRTLVEPSCGASLALAYQNHPSLTKYKRVAVIVCGGVGVGVDDFVRWSGDRGIGLGWEE